MPRARKKRKARKAVAMVSPQDAARERLKRCLDYYGLWGVFKKVPRHQRDKLLSWQFKPPKIIVTEKSDTTEMVQHHIKKTMRSMTGLVEMLTAGAYLFYNFGAVRFRLKDSSARNDEIHNFADAVYEKGKKFKEDLQRAEDAFTKLVDLTVVTASKMDETVVWHHPEATKEGITVNLYSRRNNPDYVKVDGIPKRIYRCCAMSIEEIGSLDEVVWKSDVIGRNGPDLPVFIDSHTFRQYRKRMALPVLSEDFIYASFKKPKVIPHHENAFLVEHKIHGKKIGYFVVKTLDDKVVAVTFLFLTMDGTPEAQNLYQKLRIKRGDKIYLGLDKLKTYLTTDLREDEQLRQVFDECGCGHLFEMNEKDFEAESRGKADEVRKYLGKRLEKLSKFNG